MGPLKELNLKNAVREKDKSYIKDFFNTNEDTKRYLYSYFLPYKNFKISTSCFLNNFAFEFLIRNNRRFLDSRLFLWVQDYFRFKAIDKGYFREYLIYDGPTENVDESYFIPPNSKRGYKPEFLKEQIIEYLTINPKSMDFKPITIPDYIKSKAESLKKELNKDPFKKFLIKNQGTITRAYAILYLARKEIEEFLKSFNPELNEIDIDINEYKGLYIGALKYLEFILLNVIPENEDITETPEEIISKYDISYSKEVYPLINSIIWYDVISNLFIQDSLLGADVENYAIDVFILAAKSYLLLKLFDFMEQTGKYDKNKNLFNSKYASLEILESIITKDKHLIDEITAYLMDYEPKKINYFNLENLGLDITLAKYTDSSAAFISKGDMYYLTPFIKNTIETFTSDINIFRVNEDVKDFLSYMSYMSYKPVSGPIKEFYLDLINLLYQEKKYTSDNIIAALELLTEKYTNENLTENAVSKLTMAVTYTNLEYSIPGETIRSLYQAIPIFFSEEIKKGKKYNYKVVYTLKKIKEIITQSIMELEEDLKLVKKIPLDEIKAIGEYTVNSIGAFIISYMAEVKEKNQIDIERVKEVFRYYIQSMVPWAISENFNKDPIEKMISDLILSYINYYFLEEHIFTDKFDKAYKTATGFMMAINGFFQSYIFKYYYMTEFFTSLRLSFVQGAYIADEDLSKYDFKNLKKYIKKDKYVNIETANKLLMGEEVDESEIKERFHPIVLPQIEEEIEYAYRIREIEDHNRDYFETEDLRIYPFPPYGVGGRDSFLTAYIDFYESRFGTSYIHKTVIQENKYPSIYTESYIKEAPEKLGLYFIHLDYGLSHLNQLPDASGCPCHLFVDPTRINVPLVRLLSRIVENVRDPASPDLYKKIKYVEGVLALLSEHPYMNNIESIVSLPPEHRQIINDYLFFLTSDDEDLRKLYIGVVAGLPEEMEVADVFDEFLMLYLPEEKNVIPYPYYGMLGYDIEDIKSFRNILDSLSRQKEKFTDDHILFRELLTEVDKILQYLHKKRRRI